MTDEELCLEARRGSAAARDELLSRYEGRVRATARRFFLGAETDDLVQEGMMGLISAIDGYTEDKGGFSPYANRCIYNRMIDEVRRISKSNGRVVYIDFSHDGEDAPAEPQDSSADPETGFIDRESGDEFLEGLRRRLSGLEFDVLVMYADGMKMSEIAASTGKDLKSVNNAISRVRGKLQNMRGEKG